MRDGPDEQHEQQEKLTWNAIERADGLHVPLVVLVGEDFPPLRRGTQTALPLRHQVRRRAGQLRRRQFGHRRPGNPVGNAGIRNAGIVQRAPVAKAC